jgi:hypothetical protein
MALREEWRGKYLDLSEKKQEEAGENCVFGFINCTPHQTLLR